MAAARPAGAARTAPGLLTLTVDDSEPGRIPTLQDVKRLENAKEFSFLEEQYRLAVDTNPLFRMKPNYVTFNHFGYKEHSSRRVSHKRERSFYNYCFVSVCLSFVLGLAIGVAIVGAPPSGAGLPPRRPLALDANGTGDASAGSLNSFKFSSDFETVDEPPAPREGDAFATVSFTGAAALRGRDGDAYPKTLTEDMKEMLKDNNNNSKHSVAGAPNGTYVPNELTVLYGGVYWGPGVERALPAGYGERAAALWERYVAQAEAVGMEPGCGRMQNRLVTFRDGVQACVRYRQNTDQIQGEIFSFYVARLLNLTNLAPSAVRVVDPRERLWRGVAGDIAAAQWSANRAVVLTQYVPGLEPATIPDAFKPSARHLNKNDVMRIARRENGTVETSERILIDKLRPRGAPGATGAQGASGGGGGGGAGESFEHIDARLTSETGAALAELAQWSDLIVFDYLTANLDRIVNNLFNYQWNANIMEGPAHNLARQLRGGLLVFLDNESGLLHGYRLLAKYDAYHALLLDALCVFRRRTVAALRRLHAGGGGGAPVGAALADLFRRSTDVVVRDVLPPLPERNAKVLHDRIGKVLAQVDRCIDTFGNKS